MKPKNLMKFYGEGALWPKTKIEVIKTINAQKNQSKRYIEKNTFSLRTAMTECFKYKLGLPTGFVKD